MEGLAETYGNGDNTITHYYAGVGNKKGKNKKKKCKKPKKSK